MSIMSSPQCLYTLNLSLSTSYWFSIIPVFLHSCMLNLSLSAVLTLVWDMKIIKDLKAHTLFLRRCITAFFSNTFRYIREKKNLKMKVNMFSIFFTVYACVLATLHTLSFNIGGKIFDMDTSIEIYQNGIFYFFSFY